MTNHRATGRHLRECGSLGTLLCLCHMFVMPTGVASAKGPAELPFEPEISRFPKRFGAQHKLGKRLNRDGDVDTVVVPGCAYGICEALAYFWGPKGPPRNLVLVDQLPFLEDSAGDAKGPDSWLQRTERARDETLRDPAALNPWLFETGLEARSAKAGLYLLSRRLPPQLGGYILAALEHFGATDVRTEMGSVDGYQQVEINFALERLGISGDRRTRATFVHADLSTREGAAAALAPIADGANVGLLVKALFMPMEQPGSGAVKAHIWRLRSFYDGLAKQNVIAVASDTPLAHGQQHEGIFGNWQGMRRLEFRKIPFGYSHLYAYRRSRR